MSQPKTTSQKPKPPSTAEKNLSRWMYLPRRMPSMSETATFTLPTVLDLRIASTADSPLVGIFDFAITPPAGGSRREERGGGVGEAGEETLTYKSSVPTLDVAANTRSLFPPPP